jgi:PPOX class probable FMN-dependent enzyme
MSDSIRTIEELKSLFGTVGEASIAKETALIHPIYQQWIQASPFAVLATVGPQGLDVSPRGDPAPLVRILNQTTILLPERRGNNRLDGLKNILQDPRVALLFFIPGIRETVRVNGKASITVNQAILQSFAVDGAIPKCALEITVEAVFFQCGRAFIRSGLWDLEKHQSAQNVPSAGAILSALTHSKIDGTAYDAELPQRQKSSLY